MEGRFEWIDQVPPFPVDTLYFDTFSSAHGRITTTCWIPYDDVFTSDLYRIIITQIKWIRNVVDSPSLTIKRSREGANALHISSTVLADLHAVLDIITELVNFRIRSSEFKLKRTPKTNFVDVFTINKYNGKNIVGEKNDDGKNFVVSLSDVFGVKTVVTFLNAESVRVAILGKHENIKKARAFFEKFVENVGKHDSLTLESEKEEQQRILTEARESVASAPVAPAAVDDAQPPEDAPDKITERLPSNVVKECEIIKDEEIRDDDKETTFTTNNYSGYASRSAYPMFINNAYNSPATNLFTDPMFINTFSQIFASSFTTAFANACRQTASVINYYNVPPPAAAMRTPMPPAAPPMSNSNGEAPPAVTAAVSTEAA